MSKTSRDLELPRVGPGSRRSLRVHRYRGSQPRPKAYLQAAIHADEVPALLVAHHLERLLDAADARGEILGEVVLVPFANPIGLSQLLLDQHQGRFELGSGRNFNRGFADLVDGVAGRVASKLGADPSWNVAAVRKAALAELAGRHAADEAQALKLELMRLSVDADVCLDLHCDFEALPHLYLGTPLWPGARDLAAELGVRVTLLADDSGGGAFDEANSRLWWELAKRFPDRPLPPACLAATVEYRGERDVDDALAHDDAARLLAFLKRRGIVAGAPSRHARAKGPAVPLEAVDVVEAPAGGVIVWQAALGATVASGATLAEIVDPENAAQRTPVTARTTGMLFARRGHRWVRPGQPVAKVAGKELLPWRHPGALLFD